MSTIRLAMAPLTLSLVASAIMPPLGRLQSKATERKTNASAVGADMPVNGVADSKLIEFADAKNVSRQRDNGVGEHDQRADLGQDNGHAAKSAARAGWRRAAQSSATSEAKGGRGTDWPAWASHGQRGDQSRDPNETCIRSRSPSREVSTTVASEQIASTRTRGGRLLRNSSTAPAANSSPSDSIGLHRWPRRKDPVQNWQAEKPTCGADERKCCGDKCEHRRQLAAAFGEFFSRHRLCQLHPLPARRVKFGRRYSSINLFSAIVEEPSALRIDKTHRRETGAARHVSDERMHLAALRGPVRDNPHHTTGEPDPRTERRRR